MWFIKSTAVVLAITPMAGLRNTLCVALAAILLSGCSDKPDHGLLEGTAAQDALKKISENLKAPIRVLKIEIKPDKMTIQVQDPVSPGQVNEYIYDDTSELAGWIFPLVSGPKAVRLQLTNPNLEQNLFNLDQVNLAAVPAAGAEAVRRTALDGGGDANAITIQRQVRILPTTSSGNVEWQIAVRGPRESATAYADAQGRITRLDLSGTRRAATLDYTQDTEMLAEAIQSIRTQFGAKPIYAKITVSRLSVGFRVRDPANPQETREYGCDLNGIHAGLLDVLQFKAPKFPSDKPAELFSIDDADWSKLPAVKKQASEKINVPNGNVLNIELSKPAPKLKEQPLRWRVQIVAGAMGESGFATFDPKSGQLTGVELPPSQVKPVDFLDQANTPGLFANIREDFGPAAKFLEINIDRRGATVKAPDPAHPDQIQSYSYTATERANPGFSGLMPNPFDQDVGQADFFGVAELQGYEAQLAELQKRTLDRLRLPDGKVDRLTFFRRNPFYARNHKLLLEIRCTGSKGDGRVVFDPAGAEFDLVGGNPAAGGPKHPPEAEFKSGIFFGPDGGNTTGAKTSQVSAEEIDAVFWQWRAILKSDAAAEEAGSATRWGRLAEKGPVSLTDLSQEDSREYRLAELGRIETAKKCLAYLERPKIKTLLPQLIAETERHGIREPMFFDTDFWRATIRRMVASNELKKIQEAHWAEFQRDGFPVVGPHLKTWQQQYLRLTAEEKTAREERHRIIAKYENN